MGQGAFAARPTTLVEICEGAGRRWPERLAVDDQTRSLTYGELGAAAESCARGLVDRGLRPGDRVVLCGRNSVSWVVAAFAVLRAGGVLVPLGHGLSPAERRAAVVANAPALVVAEDPQDPVWDESLPELGDRGRLLGLRSVVEQHGSGRLPQVDPAQDALVLGTSGTTGSPRQVPMTHGQLARLYADVSARLGIVPSDRLLGAVPLAHSFGFNGVLLVALVAGASVRLLAEYDRGRVTRLLAERGLTVLVGPPTIFHDLRTSEDAVPASACRLAVTGGAEISPSAIRQACAALGVEEIVVGYGLTESCGTVALGRLSAEGREQRPVLSPVDGVSVRIVDALGGGLPTGQLGRIEVHGYNVTASAPDGWLDTGDLGRLDDRGRLCVEARSKDTVVVSGFNVLPVEVEDALLRHPSVHEVAVVGVPDPRQGEQVVACLVLADGSDPSDEELAGHCRSLLAPYKVPRRYLRLDRLPVTATGKLSRTRLRELVETREAAPSV